MPDTDRLTAELAAIRERERLSREQGHLRSLEDIQHLIAAVEAVLEVHRPEPKFRAPARKQCRLDRFDWPCPTVAAIIAALTGTEPS
jgi:hypothetical protein